MKVCKKCRKEKKLSEFYKRRDSADGYRYRCKECIKECNKNHGEGYLKYQKEYRENNREEYLKYQKEYKKTKKGKASYRNTRHKRRAAYRETDIITDWLAGLKKSSIYCLLCGVEMNDINNDPKQAQLDHIIPLNVGGRHIMENVRFICRECNLERPKNGSDVDILEFQMPLTKRKKSPTILIGDFFCE